MRAPLLTLFILAACGGGASTDDEETDTTVETEESDTTSETEESDDTETETETETQETDDGGTTAFAGAWSLSGGIVVPGGGASPPCPAVGQTANPSTATFTVTDGGSIGATLSSDERDWDCTAIDGVTLACTTEGVATVRSGYALLTSYEIHLVVTGAGEGSVSRYLTTTCDEQQPGACDGATFCTNYTERWGATLD